MGKINLFFALMTFVIHPVMADCYQESVTMNRSKSEIKEIADFQRFVKTMGNQQICTVIFKAKIENRWHDARGESQGNKSESTDQICSQALQLGQVKILEKIGGINVQSEQTLYCNDFEVPQLRKGLRKNDIFKLSELKPLPNSQPFQYKGSTCRQFLESDMDSKSNDLMQWVIVGCVIRDEWIVVDKF